MKVSDLAKELGKSNKEIIEALVGFGVEAKAHNSSVDDGAAAKVRASFGNNAPAVENKQEEKKAEAPKPAQVQQPAAKEVSKPAQVQQPATKEAPKPEQKKQVVINRPNAQDPKKKKNIILVTNNAGNQQNKPQNGRPQGPRPGQASSRPGANQVPHTIIKPRTAPTAVDTTSNFKENSRKLDEAQAQRNRSERKEVNDTAVQSVEKLQNERPKTSRPNGPETNNRPGGDNKPKNQNNFGENKNFKQRPNNQEGNKQPNGRPNDRFRKDNDKAQSAMVENAPTAGKEDKRRNFKDQDKRSKKDLIYEDKEESRQKKVGKFIKPEKKVEEVVEEQIKVITIPDVLTIKELAEKMKMQPAVIIKKLFLQGQIVTVNTEVTYEDAENIAMEYEILCEKEVKVDVIEELLKEAEEDEDKLVKRPPVICVMGHVDHGKTSLLDAIRKTNVTDKEAGGITQHIGAYTVNINGESITFLDTPGHEAFTAMRMRGANSTDIAILVVAADDGVMPQTVEAINHAKAAGIEIIVAVNKIDKPGANIDRVKQEMSEYELIPVDWGGTTEFVPVSAKSGEGIEDLLETILLTAEIMELKANPDRLSRGLVIEAELDKGRGPVARILVQKGTLHVGDFISAGPAHGKVRAMQDDKGRRVKEAKPSTPVEILGLSDVPTAGEVFLAHENDKSAKQYAETYVAQNKEKKVEETKAKMSLDDLFNQIQADNLKELNIIVKADVQGSVEAVKQSLTKLSNEEVVVKCIHGGVGAINESDVVLASASSAIIIGFNVRPDAQAKALSEREGVEIRLYRVIYQAIEEIEAAMKGMLDPVYEEQVIGHAEIRQIFKASAVGNIAGSKVMDGRFERDCLVRITREGEQIYEGKLKSLKRFKDDVKEVKEGYECGLVFEEFDQFAELDIVEAYIMVEVPR
ncbi:MAG: translation initiation factor IF-2 [Lachnospiraceae bacterium]|nr:translation initiation factor IF-2 [Lachnospiraceae bacterium]